LQLAKGQYVLFLDDDDAWHPTLLASLQECAPLNKGLPVYFNCTIVKETRPPEGVKSLSETFLDTDGLLDKNVFIKNQVHMSCFATPRVLLQDLTFDHHMRAYEDWDFLLFLIERQMPVHVPILGSMVHEVDDATSDRRGSANSAQDFNAVLDYLYVYRRHRVDPDLQEKRAALLRNVGLSLDAQLL
jgi:glycosyltransferase involved in cell wall biosynthesis